MPASYCWRGLIDHCPPIEGQPADCPSEVIRFCPICDGYEAIDRRVGVLGDIKAGGKKALFLRTYTKHVSLFLVDETEDVEWQEKLTKANVRIVGELQQVRQGTENTVIIATQQGEIHEVDALYPALGCNVGLILPRGAEPHRLRTATLRLMSISARPLTDFMRQGTSSQTCIS